MAMAIEKEYPLPPTPREIKLLAEIKRLNAYVEEWKQRYETARLAHEEGRVEIERLNIRIRQDAEAAFQYLNEIDHLKELVAALRQEKERLYINVANRDDARCEQDLEINKLRGEIEQLKIDVEHWQCENANGVSLIAHLSVEVDQLYAEIERLKS
jgi:chromosome segregation ATPase